MDYVRVSKSQLFSFHEFPAGAQIESVAGLPRWLTHCHLFRCDLFVLLSGPFRELYVLLGHR
jgi:hypothetical protein